MMWFDSAVGLFRRGTKTEGEPVGDGWLVVGLGNPGAKYEATRHNVGQMALDVLADRIGDGPWLAGEAFTFADIACGHILHRYFTLNWERPSLPALAAYYERLQSRPAYRRHAMMSYESLRGSY